MYSIICTFKQEYIAEKIDHKRYYEINEDLTQLLCSFVYHQHK